MRPEHGFDLLAVEVRSTTPHLETATEICLREAGRGRRVAFVFLDLAVIHPRPMMDRLIRAHRLKRVRAVERILAAHGVTVIAPGPEAAAAPRGSSELGLDTLEALRAYRMDEAALGVGVVSSLVSFLMDTAPDVASHRNLVDRLLVSAQRAFTATRQLIGELRPRSILVFNGRLAYSKGITEAARLAGVDLLYHEVSKSHARYYCEPHSVHNQQHARAMLQAAWAQAPDGRAEVGHGFFSRGRGAVMPLHAPYLAAQQEGHCLPASGRFRIVYFASSIDEFAAVEEGLAPVAFEDQFAAVTWLVDWVRARPGTELVIRLHPRLRKVAAAELARWRGLEGPHVTLIEAASSIDSYALAASADRVVTFHSTMGIEASYLGKVSILVGDAAYRGLDCVHEPSSPAELDRLLADPTVAAKPRENCLPYGYWLLTQGEPYRRYQPESYQRGRFLGRRLPADDPLPPPVRLAFTCRAALLRLRAGLAPRPGSLGG